MRVPAAATHDRFPAQRLRNRLAAAIDAVHRRRVAVAGSAVLSVQPRAAREASGDPYGADLRAVDRVTAERVSELRRQLGFRSDDVVIGSVGRLVEQKDYPTQLRAFALAAARVPSLRMVIAGDGPLRSMLEQLARELAIADRVRFLGNWDDVPALLRSVDLFALASKFEPFGVALLEAKAAGLPIVATAVNEIPEIVRRRRERAADRLRRTPRTWRPCSSGSRRTGDCGGVARAPARASRRSSTAFRRPWPPTRSL